MRNKTTFMDAVIHMIHTSPEPFLHRDIKISVFKVAEWFFHVASSEQVMTPIVEGVITSTSQQYRFLDLIQKHETIYYKSDPNSFGVSEFLSDQEINFDPNSYDFIEHRVNTNRHIFYPCEFNKSVSQLYLKGFDFWNSLDISWLEGMRFFYRTCYEFFLNGDSDFYYDGQLPCSQEEWSSRIHLYDETIRIIESNSYSLEDTFRRISNAFGVEYVGDTRKLIQDVWEKKRINNLNFITNALNDINYLIKMRENDHD